MKSPELLMPAGNFEKLKYALMYGADAVYCGIPDFSLRMRVNAFTKETLKEAVEHTHNLGKIIYVTVNTFPHKESIEKLKKYLKFLDEIKPDALIISDPGVIELTKELTSLPIHLSVQANTTNAYSAKFWYEQGIERIVIARELSLEEIQEIHQTVPDLELEAFVHGAMCMSYSGRCLLSNFMTYRDANQGDCAQSCRWKYKVHQAQKTKAEILREKAKKGDFVLEEQLRPKEYYPIEEDENGTHIMSSRDLCLIENLENLYKSGVISFKVEGRSKTIYYVATVARAYRKAIDDFQAGKPFDQNLIKDLHSSANRGFFTGFLLGNPDEESHQYEANKAEQNHIFAGIVEKYDAEKKQIELTVRNRLDLDDELEFIFPDSKQDFTMKLEKIFDKNGKKLEAAHGGQEETIFIPVEKVVEEKVLVRKKVK